MSLQKKSLLADLTLYVIFTLIVILYAYLMLYDDLPLVGLLLIPVLWLIYFVFYRSLIFANPEEGATISSQPFGTSHPPVGTQSVTSERFTKYPSTARYVWAIATVPRSGRTLPLTFPILALLIISLLNLFYTADRSLSLPKVYSLLLSVVTFFLIINFVRDIKKLRLAILALFILAIATAFMGLLSTNWTAADLRLISHIGVSFSSFSSLFPESISNARVNVNTVGGGLTFFLPLLAGLFWDNKAFQRSFLKHQRSSLLINIVYKLLILAAFLFVLLILFLTRSRAAYLGTALGLLAFLIFKDRRFLWLIPVIIITLLAALFLLSNGSPIQLITSQLEAEGDSFTGRLHAWQNALVLIQDFPLTGTGLATFSKVFSEFYSFNPFKDQVGSPVYAHSTFLSVALDLGIPALLLYVALLSSFAKMFIVSLIKAHPLVRVLLIGLASGMLANQVFGLLDAFALGTKLGIIMWIYLGLMASLYVNHHGFEPVLPPEYSSALISPQLVSKRKQFFSYKLRSAHQLVGAGHQLRASSDHIIPAFWDKSHCECEVRWNLAQLIAWLLVSLISISFVNLNIYLSLSLAIIGGILLGIINTKNFQLHYLHD